MRLWSLHPEMLDRVGLVACWREGLLAQKVLAGATVGYTRHPQLERFRERVDPLDAIGHYLQSLWAEATARGYSFDRTRILHPDAAAPDIAVSDGQLAYEHGHLRVKVASRDAAWLPRVAGAPRAAPSFREVRGGIASWERP